MATTIMSRSPSGSKKLKRTEPPTPKSWRPTQEDFDLMEELKAKLGLEDQNIIRLALRRLAEAEGLQKK